MWGGFEILFMIVFVLIFGMILVQFIRGIGEWNQNNHSPRLTVQASVVAKRSRISGQHRASTAYYVTFQVESGDRMELHLSPQEYGMLAEGDQGKLSFQGTRFLSFERQF